MRWHALMAQDGTAVQRKPQHIPVSGIKHVTPLLAVQHATTRLTVPPRHIEAEGLLLSGLFFFFVLGFAFVWQLCNNNNVSIRPCSWNYESVLIMFDTQNHDLSWMLCANARYLSIYLLTNSICCAHFLIGENFHIYKTYLDLGIIYSHFFSHFDFKTIVSRCLRVLTNDFSPKSMFTMVLIVLGFTFSWFAIFLIDIAESYSTLA